MIIRNCRNDSKASKETLTAAIQTVITLEDSILGTEENLHVEERTAHMTVQAQAVPTDCRFAAGCW